MTAEVRATEPVFLVGDRLSFVDICLYDCIQAVDEVGWFGPEDREEAYPLVSRNYKYVADIPSIAEYMKARKPRFG